MSVVKEKSLNETLNEPTPTPANEPETGLLKLGTVSETKGGPIGFFFDNGNGFAFLA